MKNVIDTVKDRYFLQVESDGQNSSVQHSSDDLDHL